MKVKDRNIVVVGAARSGLAAARLLKQNGAEVLVSDGGPIKAEVKSILTAAGISFEENGHSTRAYAADFAVTSPGVPDSAPILQHYAAGENRVYSEIEAASWFNSSKVIAITGSNGKTTVTSWLGHLMQTASLSHKVAGNIGIAFSDVVSEAITSAKRTDWTVLEVSSFQLDHIETFSPKISCVLNITSDHLNRYENSFDKYAASKMRILMNQGEGDVFICWSEDTIVRELLKNIQFGRGTPHIWQFSSDTEVENGIFVRENKIFFKINQTEEYLMYVDEIGLRGRHNLHNSLAVALAARAAEIRIEYIRDSLMKFEGVEHRLEEVRVLDGIRYINDSKATNVNAVWYALDSFNVPLTLIMGGRDKGNDYSEIVEQVKSKVHTIISIGEAQQSIADQLKAHVPNFKTAATMEEAVRMAKKGAKRGEVVLMSPACASFDMFESYEHRGNEFKKYVNTL